MEDPFAHLVPTGKPVTAGVRGFSPQDPFADLPVAGEEQGPSEDELDPEYKKRRDALVAEHDREMGKARLWEGLERGTELLTTKGLYSQPARAFNALVGKQVFADVQSPISGKQGAEVIRALIPETFSDSEDSRLSKPEPIDPTSIKEGLIQGGGEALAGGLNPEMWAYFPQFLQKVGSRMLAKVANTLLAGHTIGSTAEHTIEEVPRLYQDPNTTPADWSKFAVTEGLNALMGAGMVKHLRAPEPPVQPSMVVTGRYAERKSRAKPREPLEFPTPEKSPVGKSEFELKGDEEADILASEKTDLTEPMDAQAQVVGKSRDIQKIYKADPETFNRALELNVKQRRGTITPEEATELSKIDAGVAEHSGYLADLVEVNKPPKEAPPPVPEPAPVVEAPKPTVSPERAEYNTMVQELQALTADVKANPGNVAENSQKFMEIQRRVEDLKKKFGGMPPPEFETPPVAPAPKVETKPTVPTIAPTTVLGRQTVKTKGGREFYKEGDQWFNAKSGRKVATAEMGERLNRQLEAQAPKPEAKGAEVAVAEGPPTVTIGAKNRKYYKEGGSWYSERTGLRVLTKDFTATLERKLAEQEVGRGEGREIDMDKIESDPDFGEKGRLYVGLLDPHLIKTSVRDLARMGRALKNDLKTLQTAGVSRSNKAQVVRSRDAVDTRTYTVSDRLGSAVELEAGRIFGKENKQAALNAIPAVLEAKGNIRKLADFERRAAKNPEAVDSIRFARANWKEMQQLAKKVIDFDRLIMATAKYVGVKVPPTSELIARAYAYGDRGLVFGLREEAGIGTPTTRHPTLFHAIEAGLDPLTLDGARLLRRRASEVLLEVNEHHWRQSLKTIHDKTGTPIYRDVGIGKKVPDGYVRIHGLPGAVLKPYKRVFTAITGESAISGSLGGQALLQLQGTVKHSLLAIDTFHASRISQFRKSLGVKGLYKHGLSILEYSKADLAEAVRQNLVPKDAVAYADAIHDLPQGKFSNREIANLFVDGGLNVAKHGEALYTSFVRDFPIMKQTAGVFNKYVFDKLSRGAMMESAIIEFKRLAKAKPTATKAELITQISRDLNFRFGNIGRQGIFKSRTMQDLMQLAFLAPKWVEAMVQSEGRSLGQTVKAVNPLSKDFGTRNTLARSSGNLLATYIAATQAINYLSTGHGTWDNEEGHHLDAWIPPIPESVNKLVKSATFGKIDIPGPNKGFWFSPLSVVAEITHDVARYKEQGKDTSEVIAKIVSNKLSSLSRGAEIMYTGRDWTGVKAEDQWDRATKAIAAITNPTPLPLRQAYASIKQQETAPLERQAFGMGGLKIEPESTQSQMARLTKGMGVIERAEREKEIKTKREKENPRPEMVKIEGAARAMEGNIERAKVVTQSLPKADRNWMEARGLKIPGFSDTFRISDYTIHTSKEESTHFQKRVKEELTSALKEIREDPSFDAEYTEEEKKDYFNQYMRAKIREVEDEMKEGIESLSETGKH